MSNTRTSFVFVVVVMFLGLMSFNFDLLSAGRYFLAQAGSSIGVNASVPPNPFNTLAQQLQDKEDELNAREQNLADKENNLNTPSLRFVYIATGALSFLFLTHLYFDFKRNQQIEAA